MSASNQITAIVLAAGASRRMGRPKQLLPWGDATILGQTLHNLRQSLVEDVIVVTGHAADAVRAIAREYGARVMHNDDYDEGEMLSSLQTAIAALPDTCEAILVVLADQPLIGPQVFDKLLQAYMAEEGDLLAPVYEGRRGNPVLFGRRYFEGLLALPRGAAPRDLLRQHGHELRLIDVGTEAILQDIDRPGEYERLRPQEEDSPL
jgi:molybdenum cofactor cytidylyltransferase